MIRLVQNNLIIPRGDTGTFSVPVLSSLGESVGVFTILDLKTNTKVFEKQVTPSGETLTIEFLHGDTVNLPVGKYAWDIKFYLNPIIADGKLIDGTEVNSYYAAYRLPYCEIRQTGDNLLTSDDSPHTTIEPQTLNALEAVANEVVIAKNAAVQAAEDAHTDASYIAGYVDDAQQSASAAAGSAEEAAASATEASGYADNAAQSATEASGYADNASDSATEASGYAANASDSADAAAASATDASGYADAAENSASAASGSASNAYDSEIAAAGSASNASDSADAAAASALAAQGYAEQLTDLTATATTLGPTQSATANYDSETGVLTIGVPQGNGIQSVVMNADYTLTITYTNGTSFTTVPIKGDTGDAFHIVKTYNSIAAMDSDYYGTDVQVGEFVMIVSTVEDPDNAKVYVKGNQSYQFIVDMSGAAGIQGPIGPTPMISIGTVSTLPEGSDATVSITGSTAAPVLNFGLPTGATGAVGSEYTVLVQDNQPTQESNKLWIPTQQGVVQNIPTVTEMQAADALKANKTDTVLETTLSRGRKDNTTAGEASIAFGVDAEASGYYSVATGLRTAAVSQGAHAEGKQTVAKYIAHAEGENTEANGQWSHSEGVSTIANGAASHAGGRGTVASGAQSFVTGKYNAIDSYDNWPTWTANTEYKVGDKVKRNLMVQNEPTDVGYHCKVANNDAEFNGSNWVLDGYHMNYAVIIGNGDTHEDSTTHETVRDGSNAYALDWEGNGHYAGDIYVHANDDSSGGTKVANIDEVPFNVGEFGNISVKPFTYNGMIFASSALDVGAFAEGLSTTANGVGSHAEGNVTRATGTNSHAEGAGTIATGIRSHAEGRDTESIGANSHAEGSSSKSIGSTSHAEGGGTIANGAGSHAEGVYNIEDSYALWPEWVADTSYQIGDKVKVTTIVSGETTVKGYICKIANSDSSFTSSNWTTDVKMNYVHITGNGTADNARSNAYALDWEGNGYFAGDVYVGANSDSSGGSKLAKVSEIPSVPVQDVQVDGTSILNNGIASIPIANDENKGLVYTGGGAIQITNGAIGLYGANSTRIKKGTDTVYPIMPAKEHEAVFYGLAKAANDSTQASSDNAVGTYTSDAKAAIKTMLGVINPPVTDVQVAGSSVLSSGVANIPYASASAGVVKVSGAGLEMSDGLARILKASSDQIKAAVANFNPIVPSIQHESAFYGLAKAAGDNTQPSSSNSVGTYTDNAKAAIQHMLGTDINLADYESDTTADQAYAIGELFMLNGKLHQATAAIASGDTLTVGTNCAVVNAADVFTRDVQVNGSSIVTSGVANVPLASTSTFGTVKIGDRLSVNNGKIEVTWSETSAYKQGTTNNGVVAISRQHQAVFYGLAKAAGDSTQSESANSVGTYTATAKAKIQTMLGVENGVSFVETISSTTPTITGEPNVRYICGEVSTISITPPSAGTIHVIFESGTTAAVLTVPNTVKWPAWFDATNLETNTTYHLLFIDGVYGSVMSWAT